MSEVAMHFTLDDFYLGREAAKALAVLNSLSRMVEEITGNCVLVTEGDRFCITKSDGKRVGRDRQYAIVDKALKELVQ